MAKFKPKSAHFEHKSQIAPNALVFHPDMSDAAKLLLLALNGISSTTPNWVIVQCDLQNRLNWGKGKMQAAIRQAVYYGYLKVTQARQIHPRKDKSDKYEKGQFLKNEFEFDVLGGYPKGNILKQDKYDSTEYSLSTGDTQPKLGFPSTAFPSPANPPLPCSLVELTLKEEQTNKRDEQDLTPVVVCSSDDSDKTKLLSSYGVSEEFIKPCLSLDLDHLRNSCLAFDQYAQNKKLDNPHGCLKQAILGAWKPNFTKQDKIDYAAKKKTELEDKIARNRQIALEMAEKYHAYMTFKNNFKVSDNCVNLKFDTGSYPVALGDDDCIQLIESFIENQLMKSKEKKT